MFCVGLFHNYMLVYIHRSTVLRPYMFHLIFLALFGFFSMHVQVSEDPRTRVS